MNDDIKPIVESQTPNSKSKPTIVPHLIDINFGAFPTVGHATANFEPRNAVVQFVRASSNETNNSKMLNEIDKSRLEHIFQMLSNPPKESSRIQPSTLVLDSGDRQMMPST